MSINRINDLLTVLEGIGQPEWIQILTITDADRERLRSTVMEMGLMLSTIHDYVRNGPELDCETVIPYVRIDRDGAFADDLRKFFNGDIRT